MDTFAAEDLKKLWAPESGGVTVGRIVRMSQDGETTVDFSGNELGPLPARSILDRERLECALPGAKQTPVLLVFENFDPTRPIIIGCVHDKLPAKSPHDLTVDGRTVTIEASEEILLRCGDSSITLKKNGRIVIKGNDIVSRASRINKLKGAAVAIN